MSIKTTTLTASVLSRTLRAWGWNTGTAIKVTGGPGRVTVSVDTGLHPRDVRAASTIADQLRESGCQVELNEETAILWVEKAAQESAHQFQFTITLEGADFTGEGQANYEVVSMLRKLADRLEGYHSVGILDGVGVCSTSGVVAGKVRVS